MKKTYLFTGEEDYLLHQELLKRESNFLKKYGPDTVVRLGLPENESEQIMQTLCNSGLFSENKLIIISGIPGTTTSPKGTAELEQNIMTHRNRINPDYFVIFVCRKPDKRKKSYKFFAKNCEHKNFSPMDKRSLPKFVQGLFDDYLEQQYKLKKEEIDLIIDLVGNSGRRLSNECKKIADYINTGNTFSQENLLKTITISQESTAFELSDAILKKDSNRIIKSITTLSENGESRQGVQGGLLWSVKAMLARGLVCETGGNTRELGLAPFVAGKYKKYSNKITKSIQGYKGLYTGLLEFDYKVKTGQISDEGYWLTIKQLLSEGGFLQ